MIAFVAGILASLFGGTSNGASGDVANSSTINAREVAEMYGGPLFFEKECKQDIVSLDGDEPVINDEDKNKV